MTHYERMKEGLLYSCMDPEILKEQDPVKDRIRIFNNTEGAEERAALLKEMLAECGEGCYIEAPFYANWGGYHVHFGDHVYANYNLTLVDDGHIYVGDYVMIGPNVTITSAAHPIHPGLRKLEYQYNKEVRIEENVWIGAGVLIMPGIHIGENSVIGAGSVVTRDIPANVVAAGVPCNVLRPIDERDELFYDHDRKIDWEELEHCNAAQKSV